MRWWGLMWLLACGPGACGSQEEPPTGAQPTTADDEESYEMDRRAMVRQQIAARGVRDERVIEAVSNVPRHRFVDPQDAHLAYQDHPLPIGHGQTISQPYIVAFMTELAQVEPGDKVLEIGTGSGYQAAVLAEMGAEVYSIEIVAPLGERARAVLEELGYDVHVRIGDGYAGWPEEAPFDAVIVTAAPPEIPQPLIDQLAPGGRLIAPEGGTFDQQLVVIDKAADGSTERRVVYGVRFVPMTGRAQEN